MQLQRTAVKVPSSMSGGKPPTNTFREKRSVNCAWAALELGDTCDGKDKLGTVWSTELLLLMEKTSPKTPNGDFSAHAHAQSDPQWNNRSCSKNCSSLCWKAKNKILIGDGNQRDPCFSHQSRQCGSGRSVSNGRSHVLYFLTSV